ncbi:unnamed protein product [Auanema sp. JU1783]|nr:unnamed protein product [Auanema sp. JU1783]
MGSHVTEKIPLNFEWLQKPWVAFVHTGRKHRIYFMNSKDGRCLWAEEFFDEEFVPTPLSKKRFVGEFAGNNFLPEPENTVDNAEPMDISTPDENYNCHSEEETSTEVATDICEKNFIALGIFDTSSLLDNFDSISAFLEMRVACIIPYIVLRELDGLTKSTNQLKKKAKFVNSELSRLASSFEEGLSLESYIDSEASLYITAYNGESIKFTGTVNDDKVLKTALSVHQRVSQSGGETENIFLITEDRNLTSKGISHGLNVYSAENFAQLIKLNVDTPTDAIKEKTTSTYTTRNKKNEKVSEWANIQRTYDLNSVNDAKSHRNQAMRDGPNDGEFKERKSERHQSLYNFTNEIEKFLFLFKTAVDVAVELIKSRAPNSELLKGILRRLSQLCKIFIENNYEHITFSAIMTVIESLYCDCVKLLSSSERIIRKFILAEVSEAGIESKAVESIRSFYIFFDSLLLE